MKATFNGMTLEGTPEEIAQFMKLQGNQSNPYIPSPQPWQQPPWQSPITPWIIKDGTGTGIEYLRNQVTCIAMTDPGECQVYN